KQTAHLTTETWKQWRGDGFVGDKRGEKLQRSIFASINFDGSRACIDNPILIDAILVIELELHLAIALHVLSSRRENFNHQIRRPVDSRSRRDLLAAFVAEINQIGNHAVKVAKDNSGTVDDPADWVFA